MQKTGTILHIVRDRQPAERQHAGKQRTAAITIAATGRRLPTDRAAEDRKIMRMTMRITRKTTKIIMIENAPEGKPTGARRQIREQIRRTGRVIIPEGVRVIKTRAFHKCKISAVKLPDSLVAIERSAFRGCCNLSEIDFGKGIKALGSYSAERIFANCNIQKLVLPPQINSIGRAAFQDNRIQELVLPDSIKTINSEAFFNNPQLEEVTIPESVTKIKRSAFADARKVHIKKYIPDLELAITESYIYSKVVIDTVTIETGGRELIIPKHPDAPIAMRSIIQKFIENERYKAPPTHDFARFAIEQQETALQIFAKTKNENVKKYLKKNSIVILKRLLAEGRNEEAVQMIEDGLMSKMMLKEILPEITEYPDVSAYVLMKLNEDGQAKQKFAI